MRAILKKRGYHDSLVIDIISIGKNISIGNVTNI